MTTYPKPSKITVTFEDGTVATRKSARAYTHAVTASAEIPELVREAMISGRAGEEALRDALVDALDKMDVVIRHRGFRSGGKDLDTSGNPSWSNYEAFLSGSRYPGGHFSGVSWHCNSEGISSKYMAGGGKELVPVRGILQDHAQQRIAHLNQSMEMKTQIVARIDDGTFIPDPPKVLRWSTRQELAVKAMHSDFPGFSATRRLAVVEVDG